MGAGRVCDCDECVHVGKEGPGVRGGGTTWSSSREESMLYDMNARRHHDTRCGVVWCGVMMLSLFVVAAGASRLA